jgi:hypothetical protein
MAFWNRSNGATHQNQQSRGMSPRPVASKSLVLIILLLVPCIPFSQHSIILSCDSDPPFMYPFPSSINICYSPLNSTIPYNTDINTHTCFDLDRSIMLAVPFVSLDMSIQSIEAMNGKVISILMIGKTSIPLQPKMGSILHCPDRNHLGRGYGCFIVPRSRK